MHGKKSGNPFENEASNLKVVDNAKRLKKERTSKIRMEHRRVAQHGEEFRLRTTSKDCWIHSKGSQKI